MRRRLATSSRLSRACLSALACAWIAVGTLQSQAPKLEIAKGTNALFGRILDAGTDAPVAGAVVSLTGFFDASGRAVAGLPQTRETPEASAPRSVMTNGDGYFFFRDLPAGRYAVAALAFGYVNNSYPIQVVELAHSDKPTTVSMRLWKFAAIAGTVVDEQGRPVAGVPVTALQRVTIGGAVVLRQAYRDALTDDRGVYRLADLPPGSYVVGVLSETTTVPASLAAEIDAFASDQSAASAIRRQLILSGATNLTSGEGVRVGDSVLQGRAQAPPATADGRMLAYATTLFPGTPIVADATVITLGSGEQRTAVDLSLRFSPTVRVSGMVTGPGAPMKHLALRLFPPNAANVNYFQPGGVATAITDAAGAFTFLAVTLGHYTLNASLIAGESADPNMAGSSLWTTQPLTVEETDLTGLVITMKPGIRVSGRLELRGAAGSAAPTLENRFVSLQPIGAQRWRSSGGRSDADGMFRMSGDPPGRYVALVSPIPGWTLDTVSQGGRVLADDVIELEAADLTGLVFTFSNKTSRVAGSVVDAKGAADADTDVIVFPADTTLWREGIFNGRRVGLLHATSAAAFEFPNLAPGDYYIAAVSARLTTDWLDPLFLDRLIAGATKFTLTEGGNHTLQLRTFTPRGR